MLLFLIDYIYDRMKSGNVDISDLSSRAMAGKKDIEATKACWTSGC